MVDGTVELFRERGYHAATWRDLVERSGTPWGSTAHHFPGGKEELGVAAIARAGAEVESRLHEQLDADEDLLAALTAVYEAAATRLEESGYRAGCAIATVALEMAPGSPALTDACGVAFDGWLDAIAARLERAGFDAEDARERALLVLANLEGAQLLARVAADTRPLEVAAARLPQLLAR